MSALLFLSSDEFTIQRGTKGNILCHRIPDFSLILFYSTKCPHCQNLVPIFKNMPGTIDGCQFGMINVSTNKKTVMMSRETIAPIKVVPYIMLYYNGKPHMRYQGPYMAQEIARFVLEVTRNARNKQHFVSDKVKQDPRGGIPEYTIGHPLYGDGNDNVCYLDYNDAYGETSGGGGQQQQQSQFQEQQYRRHLLPVQAGMGGR